MSGKVAEEIDGHFVGGIVIDAVAGLMERRRYVVDKGRVGNPHAQLVDYGRAFGRLGFAMAAKDEQPGSKRQDCYDDDETRDG